MKVTLKVNGNVAAICDGARQDLGGALTRTFRKGGDNLKKGGHAAIGAGGFSSRWQNAFQVNVYPKSGTSMSPRIFGFHKIPYAGQFQEPEAISDVWVPIEVNLPGGQHWTPRKYARTIGQLVLGRAGARRVLFGQVSVNRKGAPLRLARKGVRLKAVQKVWLPVFVAVRSVNDPKRFDLTIENEKVAADLGNIFASEWDNG